MNTDINTSNIFEKWLDYCNLRIRTYQKNVWVLENNKSNIYSLQDVIYINNTNPYDVIIYELGLKNVQKILTEIEIEKGWWKHGKWNHLKDGFEFEIENTLTLINNKINNQKIQNIVMYLYFSYKFFLEKQIPSKFHILISKKYIYKHMYYAEININNYWNNIKSTTFFNYDNLTEDDKIKNSIWIDKTILILSK